MVKTYPVWCLALQERCGPPGEKREGEKITRWDRNYELCKNCKYYK